jgi:hypothetical protein
LIIGVFNPDPLFLYIVYQKMRKTFSLLPALLITLATGCIGEPPFAPEFPVGEVEGYRPLYASPEQTSIAFTASRNLRNPGKIYSIANYLLINEKHEGIHVFDNSNPSSPIPLGFVSMLGNTEIVIRNNVLYADHLTDLVALDVGDWNNIREISRLKKEFSAQQIPPGDGRYFECADQSKGIVIGWELVVLKNPKCFR